MPTWKKWVISLSALVVVAAGLWLGNLLNWAGAPSPLPVFNKVEVVEAAELTEAEVVVADSVAVSPSL